MIKEDSAILRSGLRWATNALIAGLSLVLGCWALSGVTPLPELSAFDDKWAYFQKHKDEFDTIFIGSSRVNRQIIPAQFDAALQAEGEQSHSFNFGQDGCWPPESFFVLRKILTLPLPKLKRVFIELQLIKPKPLEGYEESAQAVYWHDRHHTWLVLQELMNSRGSVFEKAPTALYHLRLFLEQSTHLGAGAQLLKKSIWPDANRPVSDKWEREAGFHAEPNKPISRQNQTHFLEGLKSLQESWPESRLPALFEQELQRLIAEVKRTSAQPYFVVSPTVHQGEHFTSVPEGGSLLAMNDFREYPRLYDPDLYFDFVHLNARGATLYTNLLAQKFLQQTKVGAEKQ